MNNHVDTNRINKIMVQEKKVRDGCYVSVIHDEKPKFKTVRANSACFLSNKKLNKKKIPTHDLIFLLFIINNHLYLD